MKTLLKSLLIALPLSIGFAFSASAAPVPQGGLYVGKDGAPLTADQMVPPSLAKAKMAPQNQAVVDAMKSLPHDTATTITLTVDEDGSPTSPQVTQSSGSIILDEYAMQCVNLWHFNAAKLGDKAVSAPVSVPIRFVSTMVTIPAAPENDVLKDMSDSERQAAEDAGHPAISVKVYVNADGKQEGKPEAQKADGLPGDAFKVLGKYAERCVKDWTFTPAQNPDGEPIGADTIVTVQC